MVHDFRFFEEAPDNHLEDSDGIAACLWYPVHKIFDAPNPIAATKFLLESGAGVDHVAAADRLGRLYEVVHNAKILSFFREDEQDIDRVLDIFIRVNSAGKPLSQSDLLLSVATAHFVERDARAAVHSLVDAMTLSGTALLSTRTSSSRRGLHWSMYPTSRSKFGILVMRIHRSSTSAGTISRPLFALRQGY